MAYFFLRVLVRNKYLTVEINKYLIFFFSFVTRNFSSKLVLKKVTFIFEIHVFWGVDYESEIRF